ncbi:hypothetical protein [Streptomyces drozdowiczii]|uniref:Uncharacterized protein n=1 Tax=Streptomyces drozdowiczii TaxID=202862 RepID=A0ABY6PQH7_9ACTN|nr:hypothetical protein [Streptomyces drozdowiczii]MCX0246446.1 hypothetical protein [Streptomyces drozdowiczii]UZK54051.1 hypothetical protein NEH16_07715 [Streptomyces drozdowiczii]
MADRESTFAGTWRRPPADGNGRSLRELQDRASFDQAPAQGVSCAITAPIALAAAGGLWWALYEGGRALIGALA